MKRRYHTVDVFTDRLFGGNPLAVVLDAEGLSTADMQAIAAEFNYSETTFVLPPPSPAHDAHVRIFTPRRELPFAGHPNVGTGFVLASIAAEAGHAPARLLFSELAGDVPIDISIDDTVVRGAGFNAPCALTCGATLPLPLIADCLALPVSALTIARHEPIVASVGTDGVFVELVSREALAAAQANSQAHREMAKLASQDSILAYWRADDTTVHARMFAPLLGIVEDPATGSAAAGLVALTAYVEHRAGVRLDVHQGDDMGRPSLLLASAERLGNGAIHARVSGRCVSVMRGYLELDR